MKQEKNIWEQSRVELFQKLDCRETGLSQEDAADRLAKYGANELHAGKQKSVLQIFLGQFADFLVLILILAAVISACMGDVESMIVILAVITMNAILGTVQTVKASASLDSLKQMSAPTAKVLRDGQIVQIPGREVVPADRRTVLVHPVERWFPVMWSYWRREIPSVPTDACWNVPA